MYLAWPCLQESQPPCPPYAYVIPVVPLPPFSPHSIITLRPLYLGAAVAVFKLHGSCYPLLVIKPSTQLVVCAFSKNGNGHSDGARRLSKASSERIEDAWRLGIWSCVRVPRLWATDPTGSPVQIRYVFLLMVTYVPTQRYIKRLRNQRIST